jgi:hypothetical protein
MIYEGCVDYESVKGDRKRLAAARAAADGDERVLRDWVGKEADVNIMMFRSRWGFAFVGIMDAS